MWSGVTSRHKEQYRAAVEAMNKNIRSICHFDCDAIPARPTTHPLSEIPILVKDNISVSGLPLTCGSPILANYKAVYNATVVERLLDAGLHVVGKTNLDEFGMGASTTHSIHGKTKNPWDLSRSAGGSSGGSAASVASGMAPLALGSDTGGSVRQPASFCGVYGLKPTYGALSRFGLVAFASSLDCIGVLGESLEYIEQIFSLSKGMDPRDASSVDISNARDSSSSPSTEKKSLSARIAVLSFDRGILSESTHRVYRKGCDMLLAQGYEIETVDFPLIENAIAAYYIIATAEASSNLARYDGIRYGKRKGQADTYLEYLFDTRSQAFGNEVVFRTLLGTYVLRSGFYDQYYGKALAVRRDLVSAFRRLFASYDAVFLPVYPIEAFSVEDSLDEVAIKYGDIFNVLANLGGLPALSFPMGEDERLPVGMQFVGPAHSESKLFSLVQSMRPEEKIMRPSGYTSLGMMGSE